MFKRYKSLLFCYTRAKTSVHQENSHFFSLDRKKTVWKFCFVHILMVRKVLTFYKPAATYNEKRKIFFSAFITKKSISLFTSCKTLAKPLTSNKINCLVTCAFKMKSNWKSSWINQLTEWLQRAEKDLGYSFVGDSRLSKHHPVEGN